MSLTLSDLRKSPHWSHSSLNQLLRICQLQWYFQRVERREQNSTPLSLLLGSAYHNAAAFITSNRITGEFDTLEDAQEIFTESFLLECRAAKKLNIDQAEWEHHNRIGRLCVETLYHNWTAAGLTGVNKAVSVDLGLSKPLIAEYDCVGTENGRTVIYDFKTAARRWPKTKCQDDLQAGFYSLAHWRETGEIPVFKYLVVTKKEKPDFDEHVTVKTEEDFERLMALIQLADRIVNAGVFMPNESFYCGGCGYQDYCKHQWHKVAA